MELHNAMLHFFFPKIVWAPKNLDNNKNLHIYFFLFSYAKLCLHVISINGDLRFHVLKKERKVFGVKSFQWINQIGSQNQSKWLVHKLVNHLVTMVISLYVSVNNNYNFESISHTRYCMTQKIWKIVHKSLFTFLGHFFDIFIMLISPLLQSESSAFIVMALKVWSLKCIFMCFTGKKESHMGLE